MLTSLCFKTWPPGHCRYDIVQTSYTSCHTIAVRCKNKVLQYTISPTTKYLKIPRLRIISLKSLLSLQSVHYKGKCSCATTQIYIQQKSALTQNCSLWSRVCQTLPVLALPGHPHRFLSSDLTSMGTFRSIHALGIIYFSIHTHYN